MLASIEFINTTSFKYFSFASIERVAFRTRFNTDISFNRTSCNESISTRTNYICFICELWVYIFFHNSALVNFIST